MSSDRSARRGAAHRRRADRAARRRARDRARSAWCCARPRRARARASWSSSSARAASRCAPRWSAFTASRWCSLPLGTADGVGPDSVVRPTGRPFSIRCGAVAARPRHRRARRADRRRGAARRRRAADVVAGRARRARSAARAAASPTPLPLGVRAIDALATVGEGQRIGLFAGPGLGKSTLLGQIARNAERRRDRHRPGRRARARGARLPRDPARRREPRGARCACAPPPTRRRCCA